MSRNKKVSFINLVIYLTIFVADVFLMGLVKDDIFSKFGDIFAGAEIAIGDVASAVIMIIAMLMLLLCGILAVINVLLKILQSSFDKWGFSVASLVIDILSSFAIGVVSVYHLSGISLQVGGICLAVFFASILALTLECVIVTKRKEV